ncbi:unnamed protein product, partial [Amoebophrya sp. A120]
EPLEESFACKPEDSQPCPVHCELSQWVSDTDGCTATCGGGTLRRERMITTAPLHGGIPC